jgi:hypothetical protein
MTAEKDRRKGMPYVDKDVQKEAVKEALTEWLDSQASKFGRFCFKWIGSAVLAGLVWLWLITYGFRK